MMNNELVKMKIFEDLGKYYFSDNLNITESKVSFNINCKYPLWIVDDKKKEKQIKLLNFQNLYFIETDWNIFSNMNKKRLSDFVDVTQLNNNLNNELARLRLRHEDIVLNSTFDKIVKIPAVENALSPMYSILGTIVKKGKLNKSLVYNSKKSKQLFKYIQLLENLNFVEKKGNYYLEGNISKTIHKDLESESQSDVITKIIGSVVNEGFKYLTEELKLFALIPYVRLATSYYSNCLSANELLHVDKIRMPQNYSYLYNKKVGILDINTQLNRLNDVKIIDVNQKESLIYGNQKLFLNMQNNNNCLNTFNC